MVHTLGCVGLIFSVSQCRRVGKLLIELIVKTQYNLIFFSTKQISLKHILERAVKLNFILFDIVLLGEPRKNKHSKSMEQKCSVSMRIRIFYVMKQLQI